MRFYVIRGAKNKYLVHECFVTVVSDTPSELRKALLMEGIVAYNFRRDKYGDRVCSDRNNPKFKKICLREDRLIRDRGKNYWVDL
jgi:hypothetical protein